MRRSKSNPAKYARNYRSISQRRMTANELSTEEEQKELERLQKVLRESEAHLKRSSSTSEHQQEESSSSPSRKKRKHRERTGDEADTGDHGQPHSILSSELVDEISGGYGGGADAPENPLVIMSSGSKKKHQQKKKKARVVLTPQEIKEAKKLQKNTQRKLQQLQARAEQKKKRQELYAKLEQSALPKHEMQLLSSSSTLGKKQTKREQLSTLLKKERAGILLTEEERKSLYKDRDVPPPASVEGSNDTTKTNPSVKSSSVAAATSKKNASHKARVKPTATGIQKYATGKSEEVRADVDEDNKNNIDITTTNDEAVAADNTKAGDSKQSSPSSDNNKKPGLSFAAQMMASLSKLKAKTEEDKAAAVAGAEKQKNDEVFKIPEPTKKRYVPTELAVLQTAATLGLQPDNQKKYLRVIEIQRPPEIEESRYELPVTQNEYEVMDAIRNNDVTIICGETGSGKSTQIPQFLYQAGMTGFGRQAGGKQRQQQQQQQQQKGFMIGVTQPRRVAAVSTAKRVAYEMGLGNGQTVPNHNKRGCQVAYQTRYETAGLGPNTQIKFMTDGILLQEIQSDLLLRKYSVICLDEAHERNLNTDILIGLMSKSIILRQQAAKEDPTNIVPLKLVIMSATLKVRDFTENDQLFASMKPAVVTIPGRTFPVTIHHSKVTELEDYEDIAFKKICKIHRKLPQGGVLVFLTGKQEILRMVNRLRRALAPRRANINDDASVVTPKDVTVPAGDTNNKDAIPRELDDEELDGDLFRSDVNVDDGSERNPPEDDQSTEVSGDGPQHTTILPLYSLLSSDDQAKVFAPVPDGHRLIVIATNIAETSITIPGITYVVDCGRQKCRNYNAGTGVVSYDIMWISKAAADQRAGRAGRTGPGHCYRLYSSTMYSRHMDPFALPEVLTRPLEDVCLSMKAMNISNIADFPFPTPPPQGQLEPALRLLANIGCLDLSKVEEEGSGDGEITRLGSVVASLPIGVRYAKVLLVAAQAGVLDYAIATVAALSESSPFIHTADIKTEDSTQDDGVEREEDGDKDKRSSGEKRRRWVHKGGDILAATLAVGAYAYAGRGKNGKAQRQACKSFCDENRLNPVVMERIHKMRGHLARLAKARLNNSVDGSIAAKTGGFASSMKPPNKLQERLLCQSIASGLLDNVAMLAPLGSIPGEHPYSLRTAYLSSSSRKKEPFFMDRNSVLYSRDSRVLPQWICYESLLRKTLKDGTPIAVMKNITPIDVSWLGSIASGSQLLQIGGPQPIPLPVYDSKHDAILCSVTTKYGCQGWEIPSVKLKMEEALRKDTAHFTREDTYRFFARSLLEGKVIPELLQFETMLNDSPSIITNRSHIKKVVLFVSALSNAGIDSASALQQHWAEVDDKFLFKLLKHWVRADHVSDLKAIWITAVRANVQKWRNKNNAT